MQWTVSTFVTVEISNQWNAGCRVNDKIISLAVDILQSVLQQTMFFEFGYAFYLHYQAQWR